MISKAITLMLIFTMLFALCSCGDSKVIGAKEYDTYGLVTLDEKDECIKYGVPVGNIVWLVLLTPTIIVPVYIVGFDLFEPRKANTNNPQCNEVK